MFTGIITAVGTVVRMDKRGSESRLTIAPAPRYDDLTVGESIAVNGVCLTVERFDDAGAFTAYASGETLSRTTLGGLSHGGRVNLERALRLADRLGGHMVSGHVDVVTQVAGVRTAGDSAIFTFALPAELAPYVIPKGSVALDGVSLTVNDVSEASFSVNVIPETVRATTASSWQPGVAVNVEGDIIGKYVQRLLGHGHSNDTTASSIDMGFLHRHGF